MAPASWRAVAIISMQRRTWTATSGSTSPSGQTGAVPATSTRSPTRTARLKPIEASNGDPLDTRRRSMAANLAGPTAPERARASTLRARGPTAQALPPEVALVRAQRDPVAARPDPPAHAASGGFHPPPRAGQCARGARRRPPADRQAHAARAAVLDHDRRRGPRHDRRGLLPQHRDDGRGPERGHDRRPRDVRQRLLRLRRLAPL